MFSPKKSSVMPSKSIESLGPGLLETIYEAAMCIEFDDAGVKYERQTRLPAHYKGRLLGEYRVDLVVDDLVLVEVKIDRTLEPGVRGSVADVLAADGQTDRTVDQLQLKASQGWCEAADFVNVGPPAQRATDQANA